MSVVERALVFDCDGERLIGIIADALPSSTLGALIVVGGPQYRVGSHRQFVHLARELAASSIPVMRFDYRGMGDSTGSPRAFDDVAPDVGCAIDAMLKACPQVERLVIWALCDGASAALAYCRTTRDARIAGLVLVNPWVRTDAGLAKAQIKHYYGSRLREKAFWTKLIRGRFDVLGAVRGLFGNLLAAYREPAAGASNAATFQDVMADGLRTFEGPVLLMLSERDLTAKEFLDYAQSNVKWNGLLHAPGLTRCDIGDADHTFSSAKWRGEAAARTIDWVRRSFPNALR